MYFTRLEETSFSAVFRTVLIDVVLGVDWVPPCG